MVEAAEHDNWISYAATAVDPIAKTLHQRAERQWWIALRDRGWTMPKYFVFDLGVLLLRPQAALRLATPVSTYQEALAQLAQHPHFRSCAQIVQQAAVGLQDEAVVVGIQALTRQLRRTVVSIEPLSSASCHASEVANLLGKSLVAALNGPSAENFVTPIDALAIKAASRISQGHRLLDYELIDECIREAPPLPEHVVRWRRIPTKIIGKRDLSRQPGDGGGYTGLRCRIPQDELHDILPSEWALFDFDEALGLDKLLNRRPLVPFKEAPHDFIPFLRVLIVFIIEEEIFPPSNQSRSGNPNWPPIQQPSKGGLSKALVYRMIYDLAHQVPEDEMLVDIGVFVRPYRRKVPSIFSCFRLFEVPKHQDRLHQCVYFDDLVPGYFLVNNLGTFQLGKVLGAAAPSPDPYILLTTASSGAGYAATFAVIITPQGNLLHLLPNFAVPLRPPEAGRNTVLVAEARSRDYFGVASFRDFAQVQWLAGSALTDATEHDVRAALLNLVFGPQKGANSAHRQAGLAWPAPGIKDE